MTQPRDSSGRPASLATLTDVLVISPDIEEVVSLRSGKLLDKAFAPLLSRQADSLPPDTEVWIMDYNFDPGEGDPVALVIPCEWINNAAFAPGLKVRHELLDVAEA